MWSSVAVRNGSDGWPAYWPPRTMWMSVVSLARAAGGTGRLAGRGAPRASAMSASLASARMKSLAPCGSAWMRASLRSRDFSTIASAPRPERLEEDHQRQDRLQADAGPPVERVHDPGRQVGRRE